MKSVEVIIPAFNEEECIDELIKRLVILFEKENKYSWSVLLIENGSTDSTWDLIRIHAKNDSRIKVLKLSRNFKMDGGLTAGLEYATADAVILMTADLQDPPEAISDFLRVWERGFHNVYGRVTERSGTSLLRKINSQAYYFLANKFTGGRITRNASDFRLMDRKLYETVRQMDERNRFVRGLVAWAGFKSESVPVPRPPRFGGESKAFSIPVFGFAVRSIFSHSYVPIRMISLLGITTSLLSLVSLIFMVINWLINGVPFPGFGSLMTIAMLVFGLISLILGVMAEYIALIYEEVKHRPNFIVEETLNL